MKLKRLALLWSMVATAAVVLVTPSTARADFASCSAPGVICAWEHAGGEGAVLVFGENNLYQPDLRRYNFNDRISSIQSNTWVTVCVYQHINYGGWHIQIAPGVVGEFTDGTNDAVSSLRPC